jgi:photosystem II stability/assembly factor-like uncharacterized protein
MTDEQMLFDRFHAALDVEPRGGAFERLHAAMSAAPARQSRREWLRFRLGRNGLRLVSAIAAIALALAGAGAYLAIKQYVHRPVPVVIPRHGAATGECTSGLHMFSNSMGWQGPTSRTRDDGSTWKDSTLPPVANATKGGAPGCTLDSSHGWTAVATGTSPTTADRLVVMITSDGGQTWRQGGSVPVAGFYPRGTMDFINGKDGWLLTDAGASRSVYTTSDGGYTWARLTAGGTLDKVATGCSESGMTFVSGARGWITWDCSVDYGQGPVATGGPIAVVSNDGGRSWSAVSLPSVPMTADYTCGAGAPLFTGDAGVMAVSCGGNGHTGWAGIMRTADLGETWTAAVAPVWLQLSGVSFVNAKTGFAFARPSGHEADLYRTADAGRTWTLVKKDVFAGQTVGTFEFINATTGFASTSTSQGSFWKTTDGGLTWALPGHRTLPGNVGCPAPVDAGAGSPVPVLMADASTGWAVGARRTVDGGNHWVASGPPSAALKSSGYAEFFLDATHAWVAVAAGSASACADHIVVYSTSDGGASWQQGEQIPVVNTTSGVIWVGRGESSSPTFPIEDRESWIDFVDPLDGWLLVETQPVEFMTGPSTIGPLYRTTDGGLHWSVVSQQPGAGLECQMTFGVSFNTTTTGWIGLSPCGSDMSDLVTHDGGATWSTQLIIPGCGCQGGTPVFLDPKHGYESAEGPFGLAETSDGGRTWKGEKVSADLQIWVVQFTDAARGWAVVGNAGLQYRLLRTVDGGKTWAVANSNLPPPPADQQFQVNLMFVNSSEGYWATGAALYRTTDGGKHWTAVATS